MSEIDTYEIARAIASKGTCLDRITKAPCSDHCVCQWQANAVLQLLDERGLEIARKAVPDPNPERPQP